MIQTLVVTVVIEGVVCLVYSLWRKKPVRPILLTSIFANFITQSLLWIVLSHFFQHYLATLLIAEIFIWLVESLLFNGLCLNRLGIGESLFLSLIVNLASFGFGLMLPL